MKNIATIAVWAAIAAGMFLAGRGCGREHLGGEVRTVTRVDTLVLRDTLRDTVLVPVERLIARVDTVWMRAARDTVRVEVPIERKTYATDDYRAVVEGFRPALVEMELYRKRAFITRETTRTTAPKRWGVGFQAGCGLTDKGTVTYIGIGVQYHVLSW